jgi:hypothetical protein
MNRLTAAAWKQPPHSLDITLYKEITKPGKPAEEIRQQFEDFFNKTEGRRENLSPPELELRDRDIEINVNNALKDQEAGRWIKERVRINGYRQRTDQVIAKPEVVSSLRRSYGAIGPELVFDPNTPYEMTLVNLGDKRKGDYTSYAYYHVNKSARIVNEKASRWKSSDALDLAALPGAIGMQLLLGKKETTLPGGLLVPDAPKLDKLSAGELETVGVRICPDPNAPERRERIEIRVPNDAGLPMAVLICDKEDYSRVYYYEARHPASSRPLTVRECDEFDRQGFPRKAIATEYNIDGSLKTKQAYIITMIELDPNIPDEVFEFNPPNDYAVTDLRLPPAERDAAEVVRLKGMLEHDSWTDRFRALTALKQILKGDPVQLRDIAEGMVTDEHAAVRKLATTIIDGVNSNK